MKFDDLIESIDMLDAEQADEIIDWQMTKSPAAKIQRVGDGSGVDECSCLMPIEIGISWTIYGPAQRQLRDITELSFGREIVFLNPMEPISWEPPLSRRVEPLSVTTVRFAAEYGAPPGYLGYGILWSSRGSEMGNLYSRVSEETIQLDMTYELGRKAIFPNTEAVLYLDHGQVRGFVERYDTR